MNNVLGVTLHSECLSRACRTVHENGAILSIDEGITQWVSINLLKHALLSWLRVKNFLEAVDFLILASFRGGWRSPQALSDDDLRFLAIDDRVIDYFEADGVPHLVRDLRTHPSNHIDWHILFLHWSALILLLVVFIYYFCILNLHLLCARCIEKKFLLMVIVLLLIIGFT